MDRQLKHPMATQREIKRTGMREVWGILLLAGGVLGFLSQISYQPADIPMLQWPPREPVGNFVGRVGAWGAFVSFLGFGVVGYVLPVASAALGVWMVVSRAPRFWVRAFWTFGLILGLVLVAELQADLWEALVRRLNVGSSGGVLGNLAGQELLIRFMGRAGAVTVSVVLLVVSLIQLFGIHPVQVLRHGWRLVRALFSRAEAALDARLDRSKQLAKEEKDLARQRRRLERSVRQQAVDGPVPAEREEPVYARTVGEPVLAAIPIEEPPASKASTPSAAARSAPVRAVPREEEFGSFAATAPSGEVVYRLPPIDLLHAPEPGASLPAAGPDLSTSSAVLEETLRDFGIECKVTNTERGPVVTRFEILPAAGVRVERIVGLANNIALALKAVSVRVQAPIPGKGVVGIEVPNGTTASVHLRELLEAKSWGSTYALPLALGKDVAGRSLVFDLAAAPHLLIAGATGSGKTVCMNSLLAGLLMSRTPDQMRLMLIDPKIVEFGPYNGLPHLVVPVITDPKKVAHGLRWAINEMEKRYKIFAKAGVRNIKDFNNRPRVTQTDLFGVEEPANQREQGLPDTLPYIAIVVDELADLMLVAQAEIENSIARLAQLSRAVGIHMIIATQRPSVNVITGTIKANFPARIAFQVAQKVDSRTILDTVGADKLLGQGDMLFLPPGSSKLVRAQGSFTSDAEIAAVVAFIKNQGEPEYIAEIQEKIEGKSVDLPSMDEDDELLDAAVEIIRQTRRASTSSLQRRLRIGYTRAARLMDVLEEKGIIGPPQGSDPREILIDLDGEIPENEGMEAD